MRDTPILFPPEVLGILNIRFGDNAVGQYVFYSADKNNIAVSLNEGSRQSRGALMRDLAIAG